MKVLLGTNVILDFYCKREEFYEYAAAIFDNACMGEIDLYVSPKSFVDFFYITRKDFTIGQRYEILRGLLEVCRVVTTDEKVIERALSIVMPDFEDMVQMHSATLAFLDCIVTRNVKDYQIATIPVMTPKEFINSIKQ